MMILKIVVFRRESEVIIKKLVSCKDQLCGIGLRKD